MLKIIYRTLHSTDLKRLKLTIELSMQDSTHLERQDYYGLQRSTGLYRPRRDYYGLQRSTGLYRPRRDYSGLQRSIGLYRPKRDYREV